MARKKITTDEVRKIATLANITISEDMLEKYSGWMQDILEYVDMLSEVDTKDFEFKSQVELKNILAEDVVSPSLSQENAVSGRKDSSVKGAFAINSVIKKN